MDTRTQCQERIYSAWDNFQCSKNAKVEVNGKHYCTIHNPNRIKEKQEIQRVKNKIMQKGIDYKYSAEKYCKKRGLTLEQLEKDAEDQRGVKK